MSEENVEIVRRTTTAFNSGDENGWVASWASDAELQDLANAPDQAGVVKGRDAIKAVVKLWTAAFDEFSADVEEYIDKGDFVICAVRWRGKGRGSGVSIDLRQFDVYELRRGQIVRGTLGFVSEAKALEAAGLSE
jgi:ketosteroid isomerase-like protein